MNEKEQFIGPKLGKEITTVGLILTGIGLAGNYVLKQVPKPRKTINDFTKSYAMFDANSKYYKGGFEPRMTRKEACLILEIPLTANRSKIKEAHRRIMLLNHPDRGGSPYLASKINEAKDYVESKKL